MTRILDHFVSYFVSSGASKGPEFQTVFVSYFTHHRVLGCVATFILISRVSLSSWAKQLQTKPRKTQKNHLCAFKPGAATELTRRQK